MRFAFAIDEHVEALDPSQHVYRPARISELAPYQGRPGYYVSYLDATREWHCHGGWQPEQCLRRRSP